MADCVTSVEGSSPNDTVKTKGEEDERAPVGFPLQRWQQYVCFVVLYTPRAIPKTQTRDLKVNDACGE